MNTAIMKYIALVLAFPVFVVGAWFALGVYEVQAAIDSCGGICHHVDGGGGGFGGWWPGDLSGGYGGGGDGGGGGGGGFFIPPTDVCPNIAGDQSTVPAGMTMDGSGMCVTIFIPPPPPPTPPQCTLDLTKDVISWTSVYANLVTIIPLTNSPAVPGASGGGAGGGSSVFSGDFTFGLVIPYANHIATDIQTHGIPNASFVPGTPSYINGFYANKATADRLCSIAFPGSVSGTYQSDSYSSPGNNTVLIWTGSSWVQYSATNYNNHFRYNFTCVTASSGSGTHPLSGSHAFIPSLGVGTHTYLLTATGPDGSVQCDATVVIPPPPPPPDLCPNIAGSQSSIPAGYQLVNGQCVIIPPDVCPNIDGIQSSIPAGYHLVNGQCVIIPPDVCPNIDGIQSSIPAGYQLVNGQCVIIPPPTAPVCTLSVSPSVINPGQSVVVSWTSANATSGSINHNVGNASPVAGGSTPPDTIFPSGATTYTGTFGNGVATTTCSASVTLHSVGCQGNCGGGGLNPPNVSLSSAPGGQVLAAFISLDQVPYTGFAAGPLLAFVFWLAVGLWSAGIAYVLMGRQGMRLIAERVFALAPAVVEYDEGAYAEHAPLDAKGAPERHEHPVMTSTATSITMPAVTVMSMRAASPVTPPPAPTATYASAPEGIPDLSDVIESRAHAAGVLLSPEALTLALGLSPDRADGLKIFGDILNEAVKSIPREDGWILLSSDRFADIAQKTTRTSVAAATPVAPPTPPTVDPVVMESLMDQLARAVVSGNREVAFSLIRSAEEGGTNPTPLMTGVATALDRVYQARKGTSTGADMSLVGIAASLSDSTLEKIVEVLTQAITTTYSSPYTGVKLALAQAFDTSRS